MNDKEKFDALMKLADFRQTRHSSRYRVQTQVTLGLWGLLAATTIYLKVRPPDGLFIAGLISIVIGHFVAIRQLQIRNWYDLSSAFYFVEHAEKLVLNAPEPRPKPISLDQMSWVERWLKPVGGTYLATGYWTVPTALLALAAYFFVVPSI